MKIGEAQKIYAGRLHKLQNQRHAYFKQQKAAKEHPGKIQANDDGVVLEWTDEKQKELDGLQKFMSQLMELKAGYMNAEATRQQSEAMKEYGEDLSKYIETARRISKGDRVPAGDEKKLMEFSFEMYLAAKNAAMLNRNKSDKEHDSLWEEEDEAEGQKVDIDQKVDDMELSIDPPAEAVDVPAGE